VGIARGESTQRPTREESRHAERPRRRSQLIGFGYLSLLFYVLFKACEHILVTHLTGENLHRAEIREAREQSPDSL
jgi:hypothetical protein